MTDELRIWLLGGFRATTAGKPVPDADWRRSKARALVKLLALTPEHRLHREQVLEALWPDQDPALAAANLRKAVHFARRALGSGALHAGDLVGLEPEGLWIDTVAFEHETDPAAAVAIYGGDLLPEDRFEPWAEPQRERLRGRFLQALSDLAGQQERAGDIGTAALTLERLVAADPLNEEAQTGLMRVQALAGRRQRALESYRRLEDSLQRELGVRPADPTRALYEDIMEGRFPGSAPVAAGPVEAAPPDSEERKLVTVVSIDVAPTGERDPERARPLIDAALDAAYAALGARGAGIEKAAGDLVVGVFGVPSAHEDDPARALEAAAEALSQAAAAGARLRIGVDTGEVLVRAGRALGEPVRRASRLRERAKPGTMQAAERTVAAARHWRERAPRRTQMIGRDQELSALSSLFDGVVERRQPALVLVSGAAGVGKSRLVLEAVRDFSARHGARVLRGRCIAAGRGVTYWALGEVLREAFGIPFDAAAAVVEQRLRAGVRAAVSGPYGERTMYALAATAGIAVARSPLAGLEPKAVAEELGLAWPRFLSALAMAAPCVLAIEDLHWADDSLLQMLELVVARSEGPLLVLATARPELAESHPAFGAGENFSLISLRPLTEGQSYDLLGALNSGRLLAADVAAEVVARADGNPYFLEELVQHLGEAESGELPDTIHSLLAARIDSLPALEKEVLREAAVVGRVFWAEPVARSLGLEQIDAPLRELERRGLVVRRASGAVLAAGELAFKHALLREVAYSSLPRARRALSHAGAGAWLEELARERPEELAEVVAHHYAATAEEDASLRRQAFESLLVAGAGARRRYSVQKAVELHERALGFAGDDLQRLGALEELGDDHASDYHGEAAAEAFRSALEIVRTPRGEAETRARLCWKLASLMAMSPGAFRLNPDAAACEELIDEGLRVVPDELGRARLQLARGAAARLWRGSEPFGQGSVPDPVAIDERIGAAEAALDTARRLGRTDLVVAANGTLAVLYGIAGRYREYRELARREVESLDQVPSRLDQSDILRRAAVLEITVGADFEAGLELGLRCHAVSADTNPHQQMHATWPVLAALYWLGRWTEMEPYLEEHVEAFRLDPASSCQFVVEGSVIGAVMLAQAGEIERARDLGRLTGDPLADLVSATSWQARLAVALGDPAAGRLISELKAREGRTYGPQHALSLIDALVALEDWQALSAFLPEARGQAFGNALLEPWCDRAEGLASLQAGRQAKGERLLKRALARFRELKAAREVEATFELLRRASGPAGAPPPRQPAPRAPGRGRSGRPPAR